LPARVPRFERRSEKLDQISRLFCGLEPSFRRCGCSLVLEFYLAAVQLCLIGLDFVKTAANLRRLLCRHAPVFVKFDWIVHHSRLTFPGLRHPDFAIRRHRTISKTMRPSPAAAHLGSALS
jgi:hypothetical protein